MSISNLNTDGNFAAAIKLPQMSNPQYNARTSYFRSASVGLPRNKELTTAYLQIKENAETNTKYLWLNLAILSGIVTCISMIAIAV